MNQEKPAIPIASYCVLRSNPDNKLCATSIAGIELWRPHPVVDEKRNLANSGSRLVFVRFAETNRYCTRLRTDVKTDAASRASGSAIGGYKIALAVQLFALSQDPGGTCPDAQTASLAKVNGNLNFVAAGIAHSPILPFRLAELCQKRTGTVTLFL